MGILDFMKRMLRVRVGYVNLNNKAQYRYLGTFYLGTTTSYQSSNFHKKESFFVIYDLGDIIVNFFNKE